MNSLYYADPSIELTLRSGPVFVNELAEFVCTVSQVGVCNFIWLHNGRYVVERSTPYTTITHNGNISVLSIHAIPSEEAGNYTCIAYTSVTTLSAPLQDSISLHLQGKCSYNS